MDETEEETQWQKSNPDAARGMKSRLLSRYTDVNSTYVPKEPLHGLNVDVKVTIIVNSSHQTCQCAFSRLLSHICI
jgi:hypothetical protein